MIKTWFKTFVYNFFSRVCQVFTLQCVKCQKVQDWSSTSTHWYSTGTHWYSTGTHWCPIGYLLVIHSSSSSCHWYIPFCFILIHFWNILFGYILFWYIHFDTFYFIHFISIHFNLIHKYPYLIWLCLTLWYLEINIFC